MPASPGRQWIFEWDIDVAPAEFGDALPIALNGGAAGIGDNLPTQRRKTRHRIIAQFAHLLLSSHRLFQKWRQIPLLAQRALLFISFELGHDLACKQLQRLADVSVSIPPALLDETNLIDASIGKPAEVAAQIIGCTNAALTAIGHGGPRLLEAGPNICPAGLVFSKDVEMAKRIAEESKSVQPSRARFGSVVVY